MKKEKHGTKYARKLSSVEKTIQELHDDGRIDDIVMRKFAACGLDDLRFGMDWVMPTKCGLLEEAECPVKAEECLVAVGECPVEMEDCPVAAEECLAVEEEPSAYAITYEELLVDECDGVEKSVDECLPVASPNEELMEPGSPSLSSRLEEEVMAVEVGELSLKEKKKEENKTAGWGFLWCFECGRMDIAVYGSGRVPWGLDAEDCEIETGIGIMCCATCKTEYYTDKWTADRRNKESFEQLGMRAERWAGTEAERAAKTIAGRKVPFARGRAGGLLYVEIEKIVKELGVGDRMMRVDMIGFLEGKRTDLVLGYMEGGLLLRG